MKYIVEDNKMYDATDVAKYIIDNMSMDTYNEIIEEHYENSICGYDREALLSNIQSEIVDGLNRGETMFYDFKVEIIND